MGGGTLRFSWDFADQTKVDFSKHQIFSTKEKTSKIPKEISKRNLVEEYNPYALYTGYLWVIIPKNPQRTQQIPWVHC